jgi:hypothetical protein
MVDLVLREHVEGLRQVQHVERLGDGHVGDVLIVLD